VVTQVLTRVDARRPPRRRRARVEHAAVASASVRCRASDRARVQT